MIIKLSNGGVTNMRLIDIDKAIRDLDCGLVPVIDTTQDIRDAKWFLENQPLIAAVPREDFDAATYKIFQLEEFLQRCQDVITAWRDDVDAQMSDAYYMTELEDLFDEFSEVER